MSETTDDAARKVWHETGFKEAMEQILRLKEQIGDLEDALEDLEGQVCDNLDEFGLPEEVRDDSHLMYIVENELKWWGDNADH
jgi:hypothetical protein